MKNYTVIASARYQIKIIGLVYMVRSTPNFF